jgi:hypothetical protein
METGGRERKSGLQSLGTLLRGVGGALRGALPSLPLAPSPPADEPLKSSILEPEELALLEAGRKARREKQERAKQLKEERHRRQQQEAERWREEVDARERAELKALGRWGPCLPPHKRRNPRLYVQEEDLEDAIPDGWGADPVFREDAKRLAQRMGFGRAFSVALVLILMEWFHGLRASARRSWSGTGGGGQLSPEWVGRKLGIDERTVQAVQARLDPQAEWRRELGKAKLKNEKLRAQGKPERPLPKKPAGTVYLARYRVLKRYSLLTADLPPGDRRARWMDREEQLHEHVDLTGVYLPTHAGARALRRRRWRDSAPRSKRARLRKKAERKARAELTGRTGKCAVHGCGRELYRSTGLCRRHFLSRKGLPPAVELQPSPTRRDLYRRLSPLYRRLRARLAPHPAGTITPNNVPPDLGEGMYRRGRELTWCPVDNFNPPDETGPPEVRCAFRPEAPGASRKSLQPSSAPRCLARWQCR